MAENIEINFVGDGFNEIHQNLNKVEQHAQRVGRIPFNFTTTGAPAPGSRAAAGAATSTAAPAPVSSVSTAPSSRADSVDRRTRNEAREESRYADSMRHIREERILLERRLNTSLVQEVEYRRRAIQFQQQLGNMSPADANAAIATRLRSIDAGLRSNPALRSEQLNERALLQDQSRSARAGRSSGFLSMPSGSALFMQAMFGGVEIAKALQPYMAANRAAAAGVSPGAQLNYDLETINAIRSGWLGAIGYQLADNLGLAPSLAGTNARMALATATDQQTQRMIAQSRRREAFNFQSAGLQVGSGQMAEFRLARIQAQQESRGVIQAAEDERTKQEVEDRTAKDAYREKQADDSGRRWEEYWRDYRNRTGIKADGAADPGYYATISHVRGEFDAILSEERFQHDRELDRKRNARYGEVAGQAEHIRQLRLQQVDRQQRQYIADSQTAVAVARQAGRGDPFGAQLLQLGGRIGTAEDVPAMNVAVANLQSFVQQSMTQVRNAAEDIEAATYIGNLTGRGFGLAAQNSAARNQRNQQLRQPMNALLDALTGGVYGRAVRAQSESDVARNRENYTAGTFGILAEAMGGESAFRFQRSELQRRRDRLDEIRNDRDRQLESERIAAEESRLNAQHQRWRFQNERVGRQLTTDASLTYLRGRGLNYTADMAAIQAQGNEDLAALNARTDLSPWNRMGLQRGIAIRSTAQQQALRETTERDLRIREAALSGRGYEQRMSELRDQLQNANPFDDVQRRQIVTEMRELAQDRRWQVDDVNRNQNLRSRQLDVMMDRSREGRNLAGIRSEVLGITGAARDEEILLRRLGLNEQANEALALGRRNLDAFRQSYFDSFRAQELDPRLSMASYDPRFTENPQLITDEISRAKSEIGKESTPVWIDGFLSQMAQFIERGMQKGWEAINRG